MLPHPLFPPPPHPRLLSLVPPPPLFIPPPPLLLAKTIFGSGALAGVFPCDDGWSISCDRCRVISDGSDPWETLLERRSREMTSSDPAPSSGPLVSLSQGNGGGRGVAIAWPHTWVLHTLIVSWNAEEDTRPVGCDLNSKFFPYYYWRELNGEKQV